VAQLNKTKTPAPPIPRKGMWTVDWAAPFTEWARRTRAVPGRGLLGRMTSDGLALDVDPSATAAPLHPFKITAEFDDPAAPTVCMVNIEPGTLQGIYSPSGSYTGMPIFEGSGGTALDSATPPDYNVGVTEQVTVFYFKVTTDNQGRIKTVSIEAILSSDVGTTAVDVPYVQEDFPAVGDAGSDGVYFHRIGTVSVNVEGSFPDYTYSVTPANQTRTSMVFFTCGGGGIFTRA